MVRFEVILRDGRRVTHTAPAGQKLMLALRDGLGIEFFGLCGGCLSCGSCHVYVGDASHPQVPASAFEGDLLDCSGLRQPHSRLACQVILDESWNGATIRIAPEP